MVTQIYSIQTVEEALLCVEAGVDYIGLASGTQSGLPAEISLEEGRRIFDAIGNKAKKVALTVFDNPQDIVKQVEALRPDVIHICGNRYQATPEFCASLKRAYPGLQVLQAVAITGEEAVAEAARLSAFCDMLILDSVDPSIDGIGAAGIVNDWDVCRRVVQATSCPVIIAGGLGPSNVAQAIQAVRPWGVDSFTHTSVKLPGGGSRKDESLVRQFVTAAMAAQG